MEIDEWWIFGKGKEKFKNDLKASLTEQEFYRIF